MYSTGGNLILSRSNTSKVSRKLLLLSAVCHQKAMAEYRDKKSRDGQMRVAINHQLVETGEREKLKELLRNRLTECGWRDQLKEHCKEVIREKGLLNVTVDELVKEITPKGRQMVPDSVKKELLTRIRLFLAQQSNLQ